MTRSNTSSDSEARYPESGLVQRLRRNVRQLPMAGPHVLLACSGGQDSVALAWLLAKMQRLELLTFELAYIHHGQHDLADEMAASVQRIGVKLGVPAWVMHLQPEEIAAHEGVGLEEAMRRERYRALARVAEKIEADVIALAHHKSDQAETILLHLLRGTGIDGLVGMRMLESRAVPWWESDSGEERLLWRPLLGEDAADVIAVANHSRLPIVEDPTNVDTVYRRNAIRHELLPVMERIAPGATSTIARLGELMERDASTLDALTNLALAECLEENDLKRDRLVAQLPGLQPRVVRMWLTRIWPGREISAERIDAIVRLAATNRGGATVEIGGGDQITLRNGVLKLIK